MSRHGQCHWKIYENCQMCSDDWIHDWGLNQHSSHPTLHTLLIVFSLFSTVPKEARLQMKRKKKKRKKKHYLIFSPTDGGSEYLQEKRFISGCCASAFLGPQPAPWCNKHFYSHSRNSLCCQYHQHCWEWVRFPYCSSVTFITPTLIQRYFIFFFAVLHFLLTVISFIYCFVWSFSVKMVYNFQSHILLYS